MSDLNKKEREQWGSQIMFVLAAAGSAIGLGNIWRFPYLVGENGGAAFVVIYMAVIFLIGYPIMVSEMALGKKTSKNPIGAFKALAPNTPWWLVGAMVIIASTIILSFYTVVTGWAAAYLVKTVTGSLSKGTDFTSAFVDYISGSYMPIIWHTIIMASTIGIISAGVVKGIEKTVKFMMPLLFIILIGLVFKSLTLSKVSEGLEFYLSPNFSKLTWNSVLAAVGQSFFTLSLGMGVMITYGSYLKKGQNISDNAAWIVALDTIVALLAGFVIFPAVFSFGFNPASGGGLAFITLPAVFAEMSFGAFFGSLFFGLLLLAALTSAISVFEVVVAWFVDEHHCSRVKSSVVIGTLIFILGIPSALSNGVLSDFKILGMNFFDFMDFVQGNVLLPLGAMLTTIFAGYVLKAEKVKEIINEDAKKIVLGKCFNILIKYIAPVSIFIVMVMGLIDKFSK
ncbi:MAG: Sodium:neurotransmitter symporter family protein [Alphaproteobacteria bacterium ADurb.Bin438]|nr:MAG: Sodium:neurotransmitter symporter family protein [Alphaproteobacteria bacterium ADurb.Bin438]